MTLEEYITYSIKRGIFMFSYEISKLIENKNSILSGEDYCNIVDTSPQVDHHKIKSQDNDFTYYEMWSNDGFHWQFKIKNNY